MPLQYPDDSEYFAAKENTEDITEYLSRKAGDWFNTLVNNNYLEKLRESWRAYHGAYFDTTGHKILFSGEQGELTNLPVNHYRNIAQHIHVMITSTRPAFQPRATNVDAKTIIQTNLARQLLEYYLREKKLERFLKLACEYAVVLGSGYVKMEWNSTSGQIYDYIEFPHPDGEELDDNGEVKPLRKVPVYEGDVEFTNCSPFDIVFDSTKESANQNDWVICRTFKNKFDLAAKYPEKADDIKGLKSKSEMSRYTILTRSFDETVDVPVYEFFHKRSECLPEGRYILFLDNNIVLDDRAMPYRDLPIYRISPGDILGTPYGYSPMFDLLPLQDALNTMYSTILTNINAFGVQNILNPAGCNINVKQFSGGLNIIDYDPMANGAKPEALQLLATPPEVYNFAQMIERNMETISGVNSVARGNPEASLKSGNALALVQSQALQYISGLQQSYIQLIEDVGTGLINLLRDFAKVPRIAAIVGKDNATEMKSFTGDDIGMVNRVIVDAGNPLASTTAGRVQMAEQMLQMYGDKLSPEQYIGVINTGKLEVLSDNINHEIILIRSENESLVDGKLPVKAILSDAHHLHLREHRGVLADTTLRQDASLVARTLAHVQDHIDLLRETDPDTLAMFGEQPLGPKGGSGLNPANVPPGQQQAPGQQNSQMMQNPQAATVAANGGPLPQPAQPPQIPGQPVQQ